MTKEAKTLEDHRERGTVYSLCTATLWAQRRASAPSLTGWVRGRLYTDCMPEALRSLRSMPGLARASDFSAQNSFLVFLHWQVCGYGEIKIPKLNSACLCLPVFLFSFCTFFVVFCDAHGVFFFEVLSSWPRLVCDNFIN